MKAVFWVQDAVNGTRSAPQVVTHVLHPASSSTALKPGKPSSDRVIALEKAHKKAGFWRKKVET